MFLGIDVGTTGTKTILIDADGRIISKAYSDYRTYRDNEAYAEQDPEDWWKALVNTVRECTKNISDKGNIKALSLSTQAGTLILIDRKGNPIRRAITWQDSRAGDIADTLNSKFGQNYFYDITGWRLSSGFNFLAMMWLKEKEPDLFNEAYKFVSVNEYLNYKLMGEFIGDDVNAGITQLYDIQKDRYSDVMLNLLGIGETKLAKLEHATCVAGKLTKFSAEQLGLSPDTKVVLAGQDQYCSAVGMGAVHDGDIAMSTGTAWVLLPISSRPYFDYSSYIAPGRHICSGMWGNMATLITGGVSLEGYRELFGLKQSQYSVINEYAENTPVGSRGLMLLPFFQGATCPVWNSRARGTIFGVELRHGKQDFARAVMEGVVLQSNLILKTIRDAGFKPKKLMLAGGAVKSPVWVQMIADITNTIVEISEDPDKASYGAAIIAAVGTKEFDSVDACLKSWQKGIKYIIPDNSNVKRYGDLFNVYMSRVAMLKNIY